ncbi:MAG: DUF192 domain-containing protein [Solirubrobacterales bacterium]
MSGQAFVDRFRSLPTARVLGIDVPVATTREARLLGLALLDRADAPEGLLIPDCRTVHTFGMRFVLDLIFLGADGTTLERRPGIPPARFARCAAASAVVELPSAAPARGEGE